MGQPDGLAAILQFWLQLLALSWVHDNEAIRNAGARWSLALEGTALANDRSLVISRLLDGLGDLIFGEFHPYDGEISISEETRRRIISSQPFRDFFCWAGRRCPSWLPKDRLRYDHLKDEALRFANLPAN